MKILLGIVLGAGLMLGGVAFAQEKTGLVIVNRLKEVNQFYTVNKIYDYDNKVVCYAFSGGSTGAAISCLHN